MQSFLDCTQSNLNFDPSFDGIHKVLRDCGQLLVFGGIKFLNKQFIK